MPVRGSQVWGIANMKADCLAHKAGIWGAVPDAAMNVALPLAIYASVCKHLNQPLVYWGDRISWQALESQSSAMLNGYLEEWAVLTEKAANQKFNCCDNSAFSNESFWPKLAGWYGLGWVGPSEEGLTEVELGYDPPPRGYGKSCSCCYDRCLQVRISMLTGAIKGPKGKVRFKFSLVEWAKRPEIQKAWSEIAQQHNLVLKDFGDIDRIFTFGDRFAIRGDGMNMR